MPIFATRRLYLYRSDLTETGWYRRAAPPPAPALPDGITRQWLTREQWEQTPAVLPTAAARVTERYTEGGRCLILQHATAGTVYHLWLSTAGAWMDWIGARITPPSGHGLVFDVWAHPDWRSGTLHRIGAAQACQTLRQLGMQGVAAGVEAHEILPFAHVYARAGLGFIVPYEVRVWHRWIGLSWHRQASAPRQLIEGCAMLRRQYEKNVLT
ncbi:MAG: hypothetical protein L0Y32_04715 [Nevskiales bacterium]|nr:hypothetical protein [Nevskiales bacterium]